MKKINVKVLSFFVIFVFLNIIFSSAWQIAFLSWIRFLEFLFVVWYIHHNKNRVLTTFLFPLSLSLVFISVLAIAQFFFQKTLGGPLYLVGERTFNLSTPGIALVNYFGHIRLRPYSTFPHPNALAGYLAVSVFLLLSNKKNSLTKLSLFLSVLTIILSFSRTVWAFSLLAFCMSFFKKSLKDFKLNILLPVFIFLITCLSFFTITYPFFAIRTQLSLAALEIWTQSPIIGVGLGTFITKLPAIYHDYPNLIPVGLTWWLQPVHNIYLLILTQTGIIGLALFAYFIFKVLKISTNNKSLVIILSLILLTGLFDHYWLTIHQNFLLTAVILGLCL